MSSPEYLKKSSERGTGDKINIQNLLEIGLRVQESHGGRRD